MNRSQQFFNKYRFPLFFLLSYLLSWWFMSVLPKTILSQGPAFAAVIVIALTSGRAGLREFWGRLTNFRGGWWDLIGPATLGGAVVAAVAARPVLGASTLR